MVTVFYNSHTPTELADRLVFSGPLSIIRLLTNFHLHAMANQQSGFFDGLEAAGFQTERYGDLNSVLFERNGGHYMDVGVSEKVAKGFV
jgi:hypothetical protein